MMFQVGDQFDHFQIQAHMAQGGMSNIYRVQDLLTGDEVVLKIPDKMMIGDPAMFERFQRELEVMRTLHHPAIQKGLSSGTFNRTPYLVTELVVGTSLRQMIEDKGTFPSDEAVALIKKIAEGMAYCHEHDVIHRDLKPENILVTNDGQPVILDFGLALTKEARRVTYANLSSAAGTPDYMAPEQIEGQRGDERTDEYAIGTILYEMLAGSPPFTGDNTMVVMSQHLNAAIPRLDKVKAGISPQLASVVMKTLQRNPNDRYPDLKLFIADLDNLNAVSTEILESGDNAERVIPFWRKQGFVTIGISILILIGIVLVAFILQAARVKP